MTFLKENKTPPGNDGTAVLREQWSPSEMTVEPVGCFAELRETFDNCIFKAVEHKNTDT